MSAVDLRVSIGRLFLHNPILVASGTFGYGQEYADFFDLHQLGGVITKGVSLEPRVGNPAPRICETASGMLNSIGLQNPGLAVFLREKLPWLREHCAAVIVNIFGNTIEEYVELARALDQADGVSALEVNISCPNVKCGGIAFGVDPDIPAEVAHKVHPSTTRPVIVKLSPNVTDLVLIARRVMATGVDGLTLINTVRGMAIDPRSGRPRLGNKIGGLSGPAIRPIAVRAIYEVFSALGAPIVGSGGVVEALDAIELMRAGATAVQVGSATFRNPRSALEIREGLQRLLEEWHVSSVRELVGRVVTEPPGEVPGEKGW